MRYGGEGETVHAEKPAGAEPGDDLVFPDRQAIKPDEDPARVRRDDQQSPEGCFAALAHALCAPPHQPAQRDRNKDAARFQDIEEVTLLAEGDGVECQTRIFPHRLAEETPGGVIGEERQDGG
ncbi:hypothetical protein D9M72_446020 [compost metagenome]